MQPLARRLGKVKGRIVSRYPVLIRHTDDQSQRSVETMTSVIAHSAADAANFIRDSLGAVPDTEIIAYGTKGGATRRFIGRETAIAIRLEEFERSKAQLQLFPRNR